MIMQACGPHNGYYATLTIFGLLARAKGVVDVGAWATVIPARAGRPGAGLWRLRGRMTAASPGFRLVRLAGLPQVLARSGPPRPAPAPPPPARGSRALSDGKSAHTFSGCPTSEHNNAQQQDYSGSQV